MDEKLMGKISGLEMVEFKDPHSKKTRIHFLGTEDKNDVIAYLKDDMSWDIREIIEEKSELLANKEIVTIFHSLISIELSGSVFDKFVKTSLEELKKN